ncbi:MULTISPECIES: hypothetical protein [Mycolicibacter]|uniref:Uncharacterized protein n=2 Tax=Mycolicibacter TaxID=1073531 RepID=A0ABU5XL10_9MYCO|nr:MULTISPECIES: hypothetical protein [unclassified Mycolicibacter]MEB3022973.1 hypothetical protein [Mycolicibacter sp. MYC098]MEB3033483.1 hypothetical protein [Mycolicibacter sp. MYC340]
MARKAYYANESFAEYVDGVLTYHQAVITENESGYQPGHRHTDLSVLKTMCTEANTAAGLSAEDVNDIVMSSMRLAGG